MSTKVKGDKIKESSIPLSALDDAIKEEFDYTIPFGGYIGTLEYNNPIQCSSYKIYLVSNTNKTYEITYPQTITLSGNGPNVDVKINTGNGGGFIVEALSSAITLYKLKIYNYKKEISTPTPDWNAQEGEPGYIENRPFYFEGSKLFEFDDEINSGSVSIYSHELNSLIKFESTSQTVIGTVNDIINKRYSSPTGYQFKLLYDKNTEQFIINDYLGEIGNNMHRVINECNFYIDRNPNSHSGSKFLNSALIDNTVIKTTPQTLSNTERYQARVNIGANEAFTKAYKLDYDELSRRWERDANYNFFITHEELCNVFIESNDDRTYYSFDNLWGNTWDDIQINMAIRFDGHILPFSWARYSMDFSNEDPFSEGSDTIIFGNMWPDDSGDTYSGFTGITFKWDYDIHKWRIIIAEV